MDEVIKALMQYGMPGIVIAVLGFFAWKKDRDLKEVAEKRQQEAEKRVSDAKEVGKELLDLAEKWNETLSKVVEGVRSQKEGMQEFRRVVEKMNERMVRCPTNRSD